ncbi:MAG: hypothetical protein IKX51_06955 [Bacteroidales bacterium]|nr:hypothetical protein [Bacteroidales bacterium]
MKKRKNGKENYIDDVSLQIEDIELLAFITTSQSYQFVANLNKTLNILFQNKGTIEISSKNSTENCAFFLYIDTEGQLLYILLNITGNKLDKLLQPYDKLLIIHGDYNKTQQADIIYNASLPDTLECRRFNFGEQSNAKIKKAMDNLQKYISGDANNEGLLWQIEDHLKNLDNKKQNSNVFYF